MSCGGSGSPICAKRRQYRTLHGEQLVSQQKAADGAGLVTNCALQWGGSHNCPGRTKGHYIELHLIIEIRCSRDVSTIQIASRRQFAIELKVRGLVAASSAGSVQPACDSDFSEAGDRARGCAL
jgi:hypothetical protein